MGSLNFFVFLFAARASVCLLQGYTKKVPRMLVLVGKMQVCDTDDAHAVLKE